jgi:hypothetical protein
MPRILTKLRISEVSAVDKAAGEDCKIVLMKRDDDTPRSKPHVERHARRLRKFQEMSFNAVLARMGAEAMAKAGADGEKGAYIVPTLGGASDHHASTVADLLVEAGSFPHRAAALQHLLHKPSGQALLQRMHKTEKELPMDKIEPLRDVVKQRGLIAVAKSIVAEQRSYGITEHEFVELATEYAKAQHPELSGAQAFAKLYQVPEVWRACEVLKSMPFVADLSPLVVGGETAQAVDDPSEAIAQLKQLGARKWPTATEAQQFANAFTDPVNATLAQKAHRRPAPTTSYEFPR